jgi:dTMP kinase
VCGRWDGGFEELFHTINDHVVTRRPDVYIFCDILPEVALKRRMTAGEIDRFDQEDLSFHTRVYDGYKKFFANPKNGRSIHIDTSQPKEVVLVQVEEIMKRELGF